MKKSKAIFVTAILAVTLAAVWACLWKLSALGFAVMTGIFAGIGFTFGAVAFCVWLAKAPETPVDKLELPDLREERLDPVEPIVDELTYDEIRKEVEAL